MTVGLERDDSNLAIAEQRHSMSTIRRSTRQTVKTGGRIVILDYNVEETRWEPDRLRISMAFSGPCYTGEQQILGTTWWQRTLQNSSISARLTQVEIHLYCAIAPRGEPDFFDAYTSVIWQYRMQSLGSGLVHGFS